MHIFKNLIKINIILGIDTDKYKYPIGSGRVTFSTKQSYFKAITASFIEIKTDKFTKKVRSIKLCIIKTTTLTIKLLYYIIYLVYIYHF